MTTIEIMPQGQRTLGELAQVANEAHANTVGQLLTALRYAIIVGDALIEARDQIPDRSEFLRWQEANINIRRTTCDHYVRLAYYKKHIPDELLHPDRPTDRHKGVHAALDYLKGFPPVGWSNRRGQFRKLDYDEARRLVQAGVPRKEAARLLGVATPTLKRALMSDAERKRFDRRKTRVKEERKRAFDREAANRLARKKGGDLSECYSLLRKALDAAQAAHDQSNGNQRSAIAAAIGKMHLAEDNLGSALRET